MPEYIERDALMRYPIRSNHCDKKHANWNFILGIESVMEYAEHLPVADVAPVVHGRWLGDDDYMFCSRCGMQWNYCDNDTHNFRYCPNCGAKMDKENEND